MNKEIKKKSEKYFDFSDQNNKQYRLFLRTSKNKTPSFTICIISEINPSLSFSFKKTFMIEEFNQYVQGYKKYTNINEIQKDLISSISLSNLDISKIDENTLFLKILLTDDYEKNKTFNLSIKLSKNHEIYESNIFYQKFKEQNITTNIIQKKCTNISNNILDSETNCRKIESKINSLEENLKNIYNKIMNINIQPTRNSPTEEQMLTLTKEERYRVLGIQSDIVHTVNELFYLSSWLSVEKATKLDLLYKGPCERFDATSFHINYDNIVPCLILIEAANGARFGGFTNQTWKGENNFKQDNTAFLFSLDFLEKYPIDRESCKSAILTSTKNFFAFGKGDLIIYDHCDRFICKSDFPVSYVCTNKNVNPKGRLTRYNTDFTVRDLEVFLVSFTMKNYI